LTPVRYCDSPFSYQRRRTREIVIGDLRHGGVIIGGDHPVVKQSMLTCDTMDTAESVRQTLELVAVGCQLVRITAPTVKDAANLQNIVRELRAQNCFVPIVADIHFKPDAAMEAVKWVEVVRVNPGNYADKKKFAVKEYTDDEYAAELKRIEEAFTPLVLEAIKLKRCLRIGTNHGSLSDRIMNRYGDTPLGMVESALEFGRAWPRLELSHPPRCHRSGRGRGWSHQERHRHRLAALRRPGRHHPCFAHGRFPARNRSLHRFAGSDSAVDDHGSRFV
jgi:(E)-4-hydroxy-3-methylbut-2-enyl-diphosphate synthase